MCKIQCAAVGHGLGEMAGEKRFTIIIQLGRLPWFKTVEIFFIMASLPTISDRRWWGASNMSYFCLNPSETILHFAPELQSSWHWLQDFNFTTSAYDCLCGPLYTESCIDSFMVLHIYLHLLILSFFCVFSVGLLSLGAIVCIFSVVTSESFAVFTKQIFQMFVSPVLNTV